MRNPRGRSGHGPEIAPRLTARDLPRPPRNRWSGCLQAYEQDRLGFLLNVRRDCGPLAAFDSKTTIISDHSVALDLLKRHDDFAILGNFRNQRLKPADADATRELRRHLNAPLRRTNVTAVGDIAAEEVANTFARARYGGARIDPLPCLEAAFARTVARFYFGDDGRDIAGPIQGLLDALGSLFGNPFALPAVIPTPTNLRARHRYLAARAAVDEQVRRRLEPHRNTDPQTAHDLAAIVSASATAAGHHPSKIADLLIGSLLAAIRVPAAGAAWTLLQLARQPDAVATCNSESRLTGVVMETLRLYPPTWQLRRTTSRATTFAGIRFEAGHTFLVSPYVLHRDEALYPDAEAYRPERWTTRPAAAEGLLAFGRGIHRCPGRDAGIVMISAAVRTLTATYQVTVPDHVVVTPQPRTTLIPEGLVLNLTKQPATSGR